jgi:hypothetical protein
VSQLGRSDALSVGFVAILISMLAALPFTIIVTLAVIRSFQKRVAVSMRTAASGSEAPEFVERLPSGAALRELKINKIDVMSDQLQATPRASLVLAARQRERKLAAIFSIAACAHPYLEKIFGLTLSTRTLPKGNAGLDQISLVQAAGESRTVDGLLCLLCEKAELSHTAGHLDRKPQSQAEDL